MVIKLHPSVVQLVGMQLNIVVATVGQSIIVRHLRVADEITFQTFWVIILELYITGFLRTRIF